MTTSAEVAVDFTLHNVADLTEATIEAYGHLEDLGITDERFTFTVTIRLYVGSQSTDMDGVEHIESWDADIVVKGRSK